MRELERDLPATPADATHDAPAAPSCLIVVGSGRAGGAIAGAARAAGIAAATLGRDELPEVPASAAAMVLLCVPDQAIAEACDRIVSALPAGTPVGHSSGATRLDALAAASAAGCPPFSLHPLQTIPTAATDLTGAPCAIAADDADTLSRARGLAVALGMRPFEVPEAGRAAYHAAASIASNFLVALEESAADLLARAGVAEARDILAPLVLRTAANWADSGGGALTGPIARGDAGTVALHLRALAEHAPELMPLYETLAERTEALARREDDR